MIAIDMPMPKRCKGCPFTDWDIYRNALSCTILHELIAKYERIGDAGREYVLVYLYETDEKRRSDCPLREVEDPWLDLQKKLERWMAEKKIKWYTVDDIKREVEG